MFLPGCSTSLLKTLWENEKLLITTNFSFSHSVFYPLGEFLLFSSNLELLSANSFSLEESKICCLGKIRDTFNGYPLNSFYFLQRKCFLFFDNPFNPPIEIRLLCLCLFDSAYCLKRSDSCWLLFVTGSCFY